MHFFAGHLHLVDADRLGWWLCERQLPSGGLNGRPEKLPDLCYSWWVLSSLAILDRFHWIDKKKLVKPFKHDRLILKTSFNHSIQIKTISRNKLMNHVPPINAGGVRVSLPRHRKRRLQRPARRLGRSFSHSLWTYGDLDARCRHEFESHQSDILHATECHRSTRTEAGSLREVIWPDKPTI